MKPKNFPGRKNKRRKDALARMSIGTPEISYGCLSTFERTNSKIMDDTEARNIRTKKRRS